MTTRNVTMVVGSLRLQSFNRKLAHALAALAPPELKFSELRIDDVPLFNQDHETNLPASVARMKREIEAADAVLFVTPEYNRSVPGVLKNVIDWGSRPYGKSSWAGKPAAIVGTTPGVIGTAAAQGHLRSIVGILEMPLMGQPEVYLQIKDGLINDQNEVTDAGTKKLLQGFMDKFALWTGKGGA